MPMLTSTTHQAIIARELIELYREAPNKQSAADSLDVLCFAMARITEAAGLEHARIDWDELAGLFDSVACGNPEPQTEAEITKIYQSACRVAERSA